MDHKHKNNTIQGRCQICLLWKNTNSCYTLNQIFAVEHLNQIWRELILADEHFYQIWRELILADEHFYQIWRELILADPKKKYFWREEILADFGDF